jgi:drug/metabolite transporter, DME family
MWVMSGVRVVGATRTSILMLVEPVSAVVVAAIVLGQPVTPPVVVGGALVLLACVLVQIGDPRSVPDPAVAADALALE